MNRGVQFEQKFVKINTQRTYKLKYLNSLTFIKQSATKFTIELQVLN